jgi:nucleoside 2-deoxyribosyltransferase
MSNPKVYLAGPIRGLNYDDATKWREQATESLRSVGIDAMSPMRGKRYLKGVSDAGGAKIADAYAEYPLSTMKAIVTRDRHDCMKNDMVIMYLKGAQTVSIGSVLEIAWADAARVPVVLVMEKDKSNLHEHGMVREMCGFHVETLEEALEVVKAVLLPS